MKVKKKKFTLPASTKWRVLVREDHRKTVTRVTEQHFENKWDNFLLLELEEMPELLNVPLRAGFVLGRK